MRAHGQNSISKRFIKIPIGLHYSLHIRQLTAIFKESPEQITNNTQIKREIIIYKGGPINILATKEIRQFYKHCYLFLNIVPILL